MEKYYTFKQLKEKYHWDAKTNKIKDQIIYAKNRGVFLEKIENTRPAQFKILNIQSFSFKQLKEKYQWNTTETSIEKQIIYAKNHGVIIDVDPIHSLEGKTYYIILQETPPTEGWKIYPKDPYYEVHPSGLIRTTKNKKLVGAKTSQGYVNITNSTVVPVKYYRANRMVLETFNPIQNSENYVADHINGIRDDNRLENLRWVTQRQNCHLRDENFINLNQNYQKLIEKYGYQKLNTIFLQLLSN